MIILWILCGITGLVLILLLAAVIRTLLIPERQSTYQPDPDPERAMDYARKLSAMVCCETVSVPGEDQREKFLAFHRVLEELFPLVHARLEKTEIDGSLLYYWKGGRGASDTKCSVMAFFQAAEELLAAGYTPKQDVYLSSSCTEEWGGDGCPKIVAELEKRGVKPYLVCDEGGSIITDPIGGIHGNFAMIGVFEKGKADVKFTAFSEGGHASAPKAHSPVARLAAFVHEVETHPVFRRKMPKEVASMFETLAPYAGFPLKLVFSNLWLFRPVLLKVLPLISPQAGAMIRTTIAFTMMSGSDACNVMPQEASVSANMRFIPHQGMEESVAIIRKIAEKHHLKTEVLSANDYTKPMDIHGEAFETVQRVIGQTFPGCAGSPYVMTGATDSRFYQKICDNVIRFAPVIYGPEQMKGMHGMNENIEYNCLPGAVDFYKNLIDAVK